MALYSSQKLAALVAELREPTVAGEPQESLIRWLASLLKGLGIKMRTDKSTAPQFFYLWGLPPKSRGRQVPVVIERGMLRVQFDTEPGRIILFRGRHGGGSNLCAECNGVVIDPRTWTLLAVPRRALDPRPSKKKEVDRAFAAPDAECVIRAGHYNGIQVIDGYSWTDPKKGLVWCLASANGYDGSNLKWGGDKPTQRCSSNSWLRAQPFLAETGLRLRRGLLCVDDVRLDFQTLDRGRCYTIGFRTVVADPPGVWNIQSVDLASGSPRRLAFQASRVKQLTIVKISFVWSVVKTSDVVVYG